MPKLGSPLLVSGSSQNPRMHCGGLGYMGHPVRGKVLLTLRRSRGNPRWGKEMERLDHFARYPSKFLFPRHHATRRLTGLCLLRFCDWSYGLNVGSLRWPLRQLAYR